MIKVIILSFTLLLITSCYSNIEENKKVEISDDILDINVDDKYLWWWANF